MREYKHKAIDRYHFDQIQEDIDQKAMMFGVLAAVFGDLMTWIYGREGSRPEYRNARMLAIQVVIGRITVKEAASKAKVSRQCIHQHKKEFLELFQLEQRFHDPVKER